MFENIVNYFKENPIYFWIAVAIVALIVLVILIAIISHCVKKSGAKEADEESEKTAETENTSHSTSENVEYLPSAPESAEANAPAVREISEDAAEAPAPLAESKEEAFACAPVEIEETDEEAKEAEKTEETEKAEEPAKASEKIAAEETPVESAPARQPEKPAEKSAENEPPLSKKSTAKIERAEKIAAATPTKRSTDTSAKRAIDEDDKRYAGRWVISKKSNGMYSFELRASNGEKLFESIDYTSLSGAKNGIKTHKNNIAKDHIVISQNKKRQYFFRLLNGSKQLLCTGETYPTRSGCESAVESVKRFAETAVIVVEDPSDTDESASAN